MLKLLIIAVFSLMPLLNLKAQELKAKWYKTPRATSSLGASVFVNSFFIKNNHHTEGDVVWVGHAGQRVQLRIYDSLRSSDIFALTKTLGRKLKLTSGINKLFIQKTTKSERTLSPKPLGIHLTSLSGNYEKWKGFVLSAPHSDGDLHTGTIARLVNKLFNIPTSMASGCRLTYRGHWFDCNRPLQRPSNSLGGVAKERVWSKKAEAVYKAYQSKINEHGNSPHSFFVSFHGHDLTIKKKNRIISRNIVEAMAVGFSTSEIKKIKNFYNQQAKKYFSNTPRIVFGNLTSDLNYTVDGISTRFVYSALGARTYGTMKKGTIHKGLHLETPNSMRFTSAARIKTANLIHDLFNYIRINRLHIVKQGHGRSPAIIAQEREFVFIPGGTFKMGAITKGYWKSEYPAHTVKLNNYFMDKYEITNKQYGKFKRTNLYLNPTRENEPVTNISYYDAKRFCNYYGGSLPTEAQWEFAASLDEQSTKYIFSNGKNTLISGELNFENSQKESIKLANVGSYPGVSPLGLKDMGGNVWEWTQDYFRSDFYSYTKIVNDPKGPIKSTMKTIRGGAFNTEAIATRNTMRIGVKPEQQLMNLGFRCVQ